jgi:hypothetical protein
LALAMLGAIAVGDRITDLLPALRPIRGLCVASIAIAAVMLAGGRWLGVSSTTKRSLFVVVASLCLFGGLVLARKASIPRWAAAAVVTLSAIVMAAAGEPFRALLAALFASVLAAGTFVAWIAARKGRPRDGDVALALFAGYAIAQWIPSPI